jgi:hypothetical protein
MKESGILKDDQASIFEPFRRAENVSGIRGSGPGLTAVNGMSKSTAERSLSRGTKGKAPRYGGPALCRRP